MDTAKILAAQLVKSQQIVASFYADLDPATGLPAPDQLTKLHGKLDSEIAKLVRIVRNQTDAIKLAVKAEHLAVHRAIKLVGGDLFLIELEVARAQPTPAAITQAEDSARAAFSTFLHAWLEASPLIDPDTAQKLWPKIKNAKDLGSMRSLSNINLSGDKPTTPPAELARDAIKRELRRVVVDPSTPALSDDTIHLIGIAYLLAQIELAMRFQNDQSYQQYVSSWYEVAKRPMNIIAEMAGCLDQPILEAERDGDPFSLDRFQRSRSGILQTLMLHYSVPDWPCATLVGFPKPQGQPTEIVGVDEITEKTTVRDGRVYNDVPSNRQDMLGYLADTGFPLIFPRRGQNPPDGPPNRFDQVARTVVRRAKRERVEQTLQIRFSVTETVAEQHELIADLLSIDGVRDAFARTLKKDPNLDLIDRTIRGTALSAAIKSFVAQYTPEDAMLMLIDLIRRYLHFFTRHTGDNMRDSGTPYLSSTWPTDLSGRQFFDCGIYAVETAFDLMRVANAAKGTTFQFRFLLLPEHIALIIYQDQTSFCVNNADIADPRPFPQTTGDQVALTGLSWARDVTQSLYDARFAILVAALTPKSLSSRTSEALFKSSIWAMYRSLMGFGVTQAIRQEFFASLKMFDAGCALLCGYLIELVPIEATGATKQQLTESLDAAIALTTQLYAMIELLANPIVYSDDNAVGLISTMLVHVSTHDVLVQRTKLNGRLPVYAFVDFLKQSVAQPTTDQQKLIASKVDSAHLNDLNAKFQSGAPRGKQDFEKLNNALAAARTAIAQSIQNAPRIHALVDQH